METKQELLDIVKQLHIISGYHISIIDVNHNRIAKYPEQNSSYCSLIQTNPKGLQDCKSCDRDALEHVAKTNEIYLYKCHAGLYEAVSPLYYFDTLSGFLLMGQMITHEDDSLKQMVSQGKRYINDPQALYQAAKSIPSVTKEKIAALTHVVSICAGYLTMSNRLKVSNRSPANEAAEYIDEHLTDTIRLDDLCTHCFCSKTTLSTAFKKKYGMTITNYITKLRMERAAKLLTDDPYMPISTVAAKCGMDDANYFAKLFSAQYGMPPSKFRGANQTS